MNKRIIYQSSEGGVSILIPTGELDISEVARKDVPAGVAYKIVYEADIPSDREFREAWEVTITDPDGYGIGADAWFAEQKLKEVVDDNNQPE